MTISETKQLNILH